LQTQAIQFISLYLTGFYSIDKILRGNEETGLTNKTWISIEAGELDKKYFIQLLYSVDKCSLAKR
jgi:hypothetical protein